MSGVRGSGPAGARTPARRSPFPASPGWSTPQTLGWRWRHPPFRSCSGVGLWGPCGSSWRGTPIGEAPPARLRKEPGTTPPRREPTTARPAPSVQEHRTLELVDEEISSLFRSWLRALLYWEETEGFVSRTVSISLAPIPLCSAPDGQAFGLTARVGGVVDTGPRVREIKGVTLHGLFVEREGEGWRGRVIFDV
jgi:SHS2 domain-containing protein